MRVAACQLPDVRNNIECSTRLIRIFGERAQQDGADLVCFPECFLQGYPTDLEEVRNLAMNLSSPSFDHWLRQVRGIKPMLVLGLIESSGRNFYNTAIVVRNGFLVSYYQKIHLLNGEKKMFSAGERPVIFSVNGTSVGVSICNDLNFSATVSANAKEGAYLIARPCNNMMRRSTADRLKDDHIAVRRKRARESSVWLLSSDVTGMRGSRISLGPTSLIAPDGLVVDKVQLGQIGMIVRDIPCQH